MRIIITSGDDIFIRIHLDDPADEEFTFESDPTTDVAETFGFNEVDNRVLRRTTIQ